MKFRSSNIVSIAKQCVRCQRGAALLEATVITVLIAVACIGSLQNFGRGASISFVQAALGTADSNLISTNISDGGGSITTNTGIVVISGSENTANENLHQHTPQ